MNILESKTGITVSRTSLLNTILPGSTAVVAPHLTGNEETISPAELVELIEQQPQTEYRVSRTVGRERILTVHENNEA